MKQLTAGEMIVITQHESGFSKIHKPYLFAQVLEVGKVKIKTTLGDFKAKNGNQWGSNSYCNYISSLTPEEARKSNEEIHKNNTRIRLASKLESEIRWSSLTAEQLEQIEAIVTPKPEQAAE